MGPLVSSCVERSTMRPSIFATKASEASRGPIDLATSSAVVPWGNCFRVPSGKVNSIFAMRGLRFLHQHVPFGCTLPYQIGGSAVKRLGRKLRIWPNTTNRPRTRIRRRFVLMSRKCEGGDSEADRRYLNLGATVLPVSLRAYPNFTQQRFPDQLILE